MDLSKHMRFESVRLVGAVGIEPTTLYNCAAPALDVSLGILQETRRRAPNRIRACSAYPQMIRLSGFTACKS